MTKIIVNADDFGYSKGVNLGIIEAFQNGIVTSATMMTNMPGAAHAAALAKENPGLGVGIHLVLDCGSPINQNVPTLIDTEGKFYRKPDLENLYDIIDVEKEYISQIERFFSFGLKPTHIDSHHHLHGHPKIFPIVEKLAKEYGLPIRKVPPNVEALSNHSLQTVEAFFSLFFGEDLTKEMLLEMFKKALGYKTVEIMCHPAYVDEALLVGSSYAVQRVRELTILTDVELKNWILNNDVELVNYRDLVIQSFI